MIMNKKNIGFIGGGNMASAIIGGILAAGLADTDHIFASSKTDATAQHRKAKYVCLSHSTDS